jgi:hypothetical protein
MTKNSFVVALAIAGCVIGAGESVAGTCDPLNCPGNSDLIALLGPYELDRAGVQYSSRGFLIIGMTHNGLPATELEIIGPRPQVKVGTQVLKDAALVGLKLTLHYRPTNTLYTLEFQAYTRVPYYVSNVGAFPGYQISYTEGGAASPPSPAPPQRLCPYVEHVDRGVDSSWAVLWEGDRYDPFTGAIFASDVGSVKGVGSWFNISCAGEATIKMLRARTGGAIDLQSPVDQRQATLNMFTAAYCGPTGQRFTQLGQPIAWSDLSGPNPIGDVKSHEAVWTAAGAACLDVPRLVQPSQVTCALPPPPCSSSMITNWSQHGWLLSGTPDPQ